VVFHALSKGSRKRAPVPIPTLGGMHMIPFISSNLSALRAFGKKLSVIANNVANIESEGFKKSRAVLVEDPKNHVSADISRVDTPGPLIDVEEDGKMVQKEMSNVDLAQEIPQSSLAKTFYRANLKVVKEVNKMLGTILDILE
jgi:flagellar basal body rod protein FlgG